MGKKKKPGKRSRANKKPLTVENKLRLLELLVHIVIWLLDKLLK